MNSRTAIQTWTGKYFDFLDPKAENICIEDIAHSLARICRYTGHCEDVCTVAQHCVEVSYMVAPAFAYEGLMHDAPEAYLGDVAKPQKLALTAEGPGFQRLTDRIENLVAKVFDYTHPKSDEVGKADYEHMAMEHRDQMTKPLGQEWIGLHGIIVPPQAFIPWNAYYAERRFLERFTELKGGA